ncbi:MAG: purine-nucleoside phosphorylase [Planctomycetota bacterium]|nr:MAG: purine-nucleoside phosphorylase [Planctomycetota bacterium]
MSTRGDGEGDQQWQDLCRLRDAVQSRCDLIPRVAILLGTGLGAVAAAIAASQIIPYADLPGMPCSSAEGHAGELILGQLDGVPVVAFSGRLHCYEGHSPQAVVVPVRLAKLLGAEILIMGSAVGGLDPRHQLGQVVVLDDHINFMGVNPLIGPNDDRLGPRWPDMIAPYDAQLRHLAQEVALAADFTLSPAVYAAVLGPNLETRAEYRMLRRLGADVVGMSTVPEAIAAVHCGLRTLALAVVTDRCLPDALEPVNIQQILSAAAGAEPQLTTIIRGLIARLEGVSK